MNLRQIIIDTVKEIESVPYVKVGVSNRHIHLSQEDADILFGKGYKLTPIKGLLPGQFACAETVTLSGKKGAPLKARILGPARSATQAELSVTDGFAMGLDVPVNESGDLSGAETVAIQNPENGVTIERKCAIAALRHVHLTPEFAEKFGLKDKQMVSVEFEGQRGLVLGNVLLRVSRDFTDEMHIDLDEANTGLIKNGDLGKIIPK